MRRRVFTAEFKQTAVRLASTPGAVVERVAHDLGVSTWSLRRWMKEQRGTSRAARDMHAVTAPAPDDPQARIRELEAEVRRLRMERDILKKATIFFAAEGQRHGQEGPP